MLRAATLALLLLGASCGGYSNPPRGVPDQATLQRACAWLWQQQAKDGGWHSATYGLMRSGQSLTPFILHALISTPASAAPRPKDGVERALEFLRLNVNDKVALAGPIPRSRIIQPTRQPTPCAASWQPATRAIIR